MHFCCYKHTRSVQRFGNAKQAWTERTSLLVVAKARDGSYGLGEATPLPGHSSDSVLDVQSWLHELSAWQPPLEASMSFVQLLEALDAHASKPPPSGLLAVQTACLDWWCKYRHSTLDAEIRQLLGGNVSQARETTDAQRPLCLVPLLDCHAPNVIQYTSKLLNEGYSTYKVKIGLDVDRELEVLRHVVDLAQNGRHCVAFRLDANQVLDPGRVREMLARFSVLPVEYVEEPCAIEQLTPGDALPLPLALDESLEQGPEKLAPWLRRGNLAALVCKPMLIGDLRAVANWHGQAEAADCRFVLSHLFDGILAMRLYDALARTLSPHTCHGLFPHSAIDLWSDWVTETGGPGLGLTLTEQALATLMHTSGASA